MKFIKILRVDLWQLTGYLHFMGFLQTTGFMIQNKFKSRVHKDLYVYMDHKYFNIQVANEKHTNYYWWFLVF